MQIFSAESLDRAAHRREDEDWLRNAFDTTSRLVVFSNGKPVVRPGAKRTDPVEISWFKGADFSEYSERIFLGESAEGPVFAIDLGAEKPIQGKPIDLRSIAFTLSQGDAGLLAQAQTLLRWHKNSSFCPRCGSKTAISLAGDRRKCSGCGLEIYPRINPVVIMLIHNGDRCLLGRRFEFPKNMWSCLAGFVEAGESLKAAVIRESKEEADVDITEVQFYDDQPWPFPSQLMLGCYAHAANRNATPDGVETEAVRWFSREELDKILRFEAPNGEKIPGPAAIAHNLIRDWVYQ